MPTVKSEEEESLSPRLPAVMLPKLPWAQIMAISIFWFALNFHWAALGIIILPSQVFKLVGDAHKGEALAYVLIPGAFVSLFANPFFGWLSDRARGRLAAWGRRRPYILIGTLVNVGGLVWMAAAPSISALAMAYILVQFASNAAQAPFHALLPDVVPREQRGLVSGVMGVLLIAGNIAGVVMAGIFINASQPPSVYQHSLGITYGIIIAVMLALMLVTIISVRERVGLSAQLAAPSPVKHEKRQKWLTGSWLFIIGGTLAATALVWGILFLWNEYHMANMRVSNDVQQVILEMVVTVGIFRIFDFNPRRDPDFAWVLVTRFLMMMGIYTIQAFLQYYMRDVVGVPDPEQETTKFVIIAALTSLVSAIFAGWLSDRFGRKRIIYISGGMMALVGLIVIVAQLFTRSLPLIFVAGAIFGIGAGAYQSVDWALVADVLPSHRSYAKDMGVWNISLSLPQVIAPVIGGPLIDAFTQRGAPVVGFQVLFAMAVMYCLVSTLAVRNIRGVKH
jgi:MFS family permease